MKTPYAVLLLLLGVFLGAAWLDHPVVLRNDADVVEIVYWEKWTGFEGEAMSATIDFFNAQKIRNEKGQLIQCRYLATTQVDRKSLLAIAGGNPPDLAGFTISLSAAR
jgi:ABC-type glycerol-3-phosphate transport system substrate-binding protein